MTTVTSEKLLSLEQAWRESRALEDEVRLLDELSRTGELGSFWPRKSLRSRRFWRGYLGFNDDISGLQGQTIELPLSIEHALLVRLDEHLPDAALLLAHPSFESPVELARRELLAPRPDVLRWEELQLVIDMQRRFFPKRLPESTTLLLHPFTPPVAEASLPIYHATVEAALQKASGFTDGEIDSFLIWRSTGDVHWERTDQGYMLTGDDLEKEDYLSLRVDDDEATVSELPFEALEEVFERCRELLAAARRVGDPGGATLPWDSDEEEDDDW